MQRKLKTIIVDDEALARQLLKVTLVELGNVDIVAECKNGREAVEKAVELNPDLMFLDIQMPGMSGIDAVYALQADVMPLVVFTTAYDKFAVEAFKLHAVDYLLKPLDEELVKQSVERAIQRLQSVNDAPTRKQDSVAALTDIKSTDTAPTNEITFHSNKLAIKDGREIDLIELDSIDWIDAAGDLMCVHSAGKTYLMRSTMTNLINQLDASIFKRIHRSTIVNLNRIERIVSHLKGEYFIFLSCGEKLKVSRGYKDVINDFIKDNS